MKITANFTGRGKLFDNLKWLEKHMKDTVPLYKSLGMVTRKWILTAFRKGGPPHAKWPPLSPLTVMGRRKGSRKPLLDTGHMMKQWTYRATRRAAIIGNIMDIAAWHHTGYRIPPLKPIKKKVLWFGVTPKVRRQGQAGGFKGKSPGIFAMSTKGATVPARRQLPTKREILPQLNAAVDVWMQKEIQKRNFGRGL